MPPNHSVLPFRFPEPEANGYICNRIGCHNAHHRNTLPGNATTTYLRPDPDGCHCSPIQETRCPYQYGFEAFSRHFHYKKGCCPEIGNCHLQLKNLRKEGLPHHPSCCQPYSHRHSDSNISRLPKEKLFAHATNYRPWFRSTPQNPHLPAQTNPEWNIPNPHSLHYGPRCDKQ